MLVSNGIEAGSVIVVDHGMISNDAACPHATLVSLMDINLHKNTNEIQQQYLNCIVVAEQLKCCIKTRRRRVAVWSNRERERGREQKINSALSTMASIVLDAFNTRHVVSLTYQ